MKLKDEQENGSSSEQAEVIIKKSLKQYQCYRSAVFLILLNVRYISFQ